MEKTFFKGFLLVVAYTVIIIAVKNTSKKSQTCLPSKQELNTSKNSVGDVPFHKDNDGRWRICFNNDVLSLPKPMSAAVRNLAKTSFLYAEEEPLTCDRCHGARSLTYNGSFMLKPAVYSNFDPCRNVSADLKNPECGHDPMFISDDLRTEYKGYCTTFLTKSLYLQHVKQPDRMYSSSQLCTIQIFSLEAAHVCFKKQSIRHILFLGDSRILDKFYFFSEQFNEGCKFRYSKTDFCCDTSALKIRYKRYNFIDESLNATLQNITIGKVKTPDVIILSFCLWYFNYQVKNPPGEHQYIFMHKTLMRSLDKIKTATIILLYPDDVSQSAWPRFLRARAICSQLYDSFSMTSSPNGNIFMMKSLHSAGKRFGYRDGTRHVTAVGNRMNAQILLNFMCSAKNHSVTEDSMIPIPNSQNASKTVHICCH